MVPSDGSHNFFVKVLKYGSLDSVGCIKGQMIKGS